MTALRLHSQATRLRSDCTPKHHDCAQIALPSNKIALRLHSKTPRLRSDCTPKHHDCAQIALRNTTTTLRLHSQIPELHSDCTPDDQDCNPKLLKLRSERSLGALLYASREQSDCNPKSGCLAGRSERTPSVNIQDSGFCGWHWWRTYARRSRCFVHEFKVRTCRI